MTKKSRKIKKEIKEIKEEKVNKYTAFLGTFMFIVILFLIVYYSNFFQTSIEPARGYQETQTPITTESKILGGSCKRDSECFITTCKDTQTKDCLNTTQITDYYKNCKTYSDWIVEKQDISKCACVQNVCKMLR